MFFFKGFQRKVLFLLSDIRTSIRELGKDIAPEDTVFHVEKIETMEQFMRQELRFKSDNMARSNVVSLEIFARLEISR